MTSTYNMYSLTLLVTVSALLEVVHSGHQSYVYTVIGDERQQTVTTRGTTFVTEYDCHVNFATCATISHGLLKFWAIAKSHLFGFCEC